MISLKGNFIKDEIWMLTIGASFQRAKVYKTSCANNEKLAFRNSLKTFITSLSEKYSTESFTEEQHVKNIYSISEESKKFSSYLSRGQLNFGICQKMLNLYLKYVWCLGHIKTTPPHFPVDRIIQKKLNIRKPYSWTQMSNSEKYMEVIQVAKNSLKSYNLKTVAELELFLFQRR